MTIPADIETLVDGSFNARVRLDKLEPIREWDDEWLRVFDPRRRFIPPEESAN